MITGGRVKLVGVDLCLWKRKSKRSRKRKGLQVRQASDITLDNINYLLCN